MPKRLIPSSPLPHFKTARSRSEGPRSFASEGGGRLSLLHLSAARILRPASSSFAGGGGVGLPFRAANNSRPA